MKRQAHPQQPVYQPTRRRVQRHAAAKPAMQPQQPLNNSDVTFAARLLKAIIVVCMGYAIIPLEWLHAIGRLL
ncbi:MAG: hypothetical protein BWK73_25605 [Thiothrix lacustris]|uniref:Uncharacterized protein n=1 Tax=Thiothrix lacustris TaxID=525917 RepID=A0A1Y1QLM0_9GAMM|nr:MAG: hypothetical protein BWK73_25605 [Thiothrix lacustris]